MAAGFLEHALRRAMGDPELRIIGVHAAGGGCIHNAARVTTSAGNAFVKWNADVPDDLFLREAEGLRELLAAGSDLVIPRVLLAAAPQGAAPGFIVMELLAQAAGRGAATDEALGRGLAAIHRRSAEAFGFRVDTYCGSTLQDNTRSGSWVEFYRERRLRFLLERLVENRGLAAAEGRVLERLADRLPDLLPHDPPPSLIHGDLWSGNVMATPSGPALFDPACAYADREMEFGITTLFGGFSDRFFRAYEEAWPLPAGWRERNGLYQLYHLLNHQLIFGGHYAADALATARRYI
jgi:protein-ribulosamine 3-kinase